MKTHIGFCGIDCEKCDAYIATLRDDDTLREKTARRWSELNHATILPEHINCQGCRTSGTKTVFCETICLIRKCALAKNLPTCGECEERDICDKLLAITSNNPEARENLIRKG